MEYSRIVSADGVEAGNGAAFISEIVNTHSDTDGTLATAVGGVIYALRYELMFSMVFIVLLYFTRRPEAPKTGKQSKSVVSEIVDCCASKYSKAADMFFRLPSAELTSLEPEELLRLVTAFALSSVRVGRTDRIAQIFATIHKCGLQDPGVLPPVMRMLGSRNHYALVFQVYDSWQTYFGKQEVPGAALSCMVHSAVELGMEEKAVEYLDLLTTRKEVAARDYAAVIRLYVKMENSAAALAMLHRMEEAGLKPDNVSYNMVLSTCSNAKQREQVTGLLSSMDADVVTYNTRLKTCVQDRDVTKAFALFEDLERSGIQPTQVTYGTLMECCTRAGDMVKAKEVLNKMTERGVQKNIVVYTSIIKGFAGVGKLEEAMEVFEEMQKSGKGEGSEAGGLEPDVICYSALIKAFCDRRELEQAFLLLEQLLEKGHTPDEILFNHLLAGCAAQPHVQLGEKIVADMVGHGIKPTTATFSTLMKVYAKAGDLQASADLLEQIPTLYKTVPALRLYQQHISWAIRMRKGHSTIQVYKLMHSRIPNQNSDAIILACQTFNMMDTGVEIIEINPHRFTRMALQQMVDVLVKKKKPALLARVEKCLSDAGIKGISPAASA